MAEQNKETLPLQNVNALFDLEKSRFHSFINNVKDAKHRADALLQSINAKREDILNEKDNKTEDVIMSEQILQVGANATDSEEKIDEIVKDVKLENQTEPVSDIKEIEVSAKKDEKESISQQAKEVSKPSASVESNPLRAKVASEPRKYEPPKPSRIYIPESERGVGRNFNNGGYRGNGNSNGYNRPQQAGGFSGFSNIAEKDKPMFVPPQNGKNNKGTKKNNSYEKNNYNEEKGQSKRSILRREMENDSMDDGDVARRFKSKKQKQSQAVAQIVIEKAVINVDPVPIKVLSEKIGKPSADIIRKLLMEGILKTINDSIDYATAELVAANYDIELELKADKTAEEKLEEIMSTDGTDNTEPRAPIITIMGHVDHGKTSLLDYIRNSHVADKEAGGITQHIGAYTIEKNGQMLTFIDTPGHEAFTTMRARGAMVTDIAIIVVAADDGIMPQTVESINHAKAAGVPIIVAVNKIDKVGADIERVKVELSNNGLLIEEWGGDVICCPISAKTGQGVEQLLESILLVAEVAELKANSKKSAQGTVIEARLDKGSGPIATVLVQNGTLRVGDFMVAGSVCGRVKSMLNDKSKLVKVAGPSTPVAVLGFDEVPSAGDKVFVVADEKLAKKIAEERKNKVNKSDDESKPANLEALFAQINEGKLKELNLIVKADVQGSVEALVQELKKLSNEEVKVHIVHSGVGAINESDVVLASTSNSIIIGFNVRPDTNSKLAATKYSVDIRNYRIIYDVINDVTLALKGMLAPKFRENVLGKAEVRDTFKISGVGTIAGCHVIEGKLERNASLRLLRDNVVITENKVSSLKRLKDDVKEVLSGFDCGVGIENYNDIKIGDVIECFVMEQVND